MSYSKIAGERENKKVQQNISPSLKVCPGKIVIESGIS